MKKKKIDDIVSNYDKIEWNTEDFLKINPQSNFELYLEFTESLAGCHCQIECIQNDSNKIISEWKEYYNNDGDIIFEEGDGSGWYENEKLFDPTLPVLGGDREDGVERVDLVYLVKIKSMDFIKKLFDIIKKSEYEDIDSWLSDNITHSPEFFDELCNEIDFNDRKDKYLLYETAILDKYICKWYSHLDITGSFLRLGYIEGQKA